MSRAVHAAEAAPNGGRRCGSSSYRVRPVRAPITHHSPQRSDARLHGFLRLPDGQVMGGGSDRPDEYRGSVHAPQDQGTLVTDPAVERIRPNIHDLAATFACLVDVVVADHGGPRHRESPRVHIVVEPAPCSFEYRPRCLRCHRSQPDDRPKVRSVPAGVSIDEGALRVMPTRPRSAHSGPRPHRQSAIRSRMITMAPGEWAGGTLRV